MALTHRSPRLGFGGRSSTAIALQSGIALVLAFVAVPLCAQTSIDRAVTSVTVLPAGTSSTGEPLYDIRATFHVSASGSSSVPVDASTSLEIFVAGQLISSRLVDIELAAGFFDCSTPPCNGGCGSASIDGVFNSLICAKDLPCNGGSCFCECRTLPVADGNTSECSLGDVIDVVLTAGATALPDADPSNDVLSFSFDGESSFYHRRVDSVAVTPDAAGGSLVTISGSVIFNAMPLAALDLSLEVELYDQGVLIATNNVEIPVEPGVGSCFGAGCGSSCGVVNGLPANCDPTFFLGCACLSGWLTQIPGVDLPDGPDGLTVLLRPVPGALPELPGFPSEEQEFQRGDCTHDGVVGLTDVLFSLNYLFLGGPEGVCVDACDFNDDGSIDLPDQLYLLNYLFLAGSAPPMPFNECGLDPTDDTLDCEEYLCIR